MPAFSDFGSFPKSALDSFCTSPCPFGCFCWFSRKHSGADMASIRRWIAIKWGQFPFAKAHFDFGLFEYEPNVWPIKADRQQQRFGCAKSEKNNKIKYNSVFIYFVVGCLVLLFGPQLPLCPRDLFCFRSGMCICVCAYVFVNMWWWAFCHWCSIVRVSVQK